MPQPSRQSRALTRAHTVAMESISSVAFQALADVSPFRIEAGRHAPIAAVHARSALVNVCGTKGGTGHWGQETSTSTHKLKQHTMHPSQTVQSLGICALEAIGKRRAFVVVFGRKFDEGVLKYKRFSPKLSIGDHKIFA